MDLPTAYYKGSTIIPVVRSGKPGFSADALIVNRFGSCRTLGHLGWFSFEDEAAEHALYCAKLVLDGRSG
jgi:hypothetical protein